MKDTWKYEFRPVILSRGEDYWMSGCVEQVVKTKDGYHAIVSGSYEYEVDIEVHKDEVINMSCTCPYGEDNNCKHMAAVLFAIAEGEYETENEPAGFKDDADDILDRLSEKQLRSELKEIIDEDPKYRKRLISRYRTHKAEQRDISSCIADLDSLAWEYGDRDGFIDWRSGQDYVNAFCSCLSESIDPMIARGEILPAFEVLKGAYYILNKVDMDGSSGEHSDIAYDIKEYWNTLIHMAESEDKDKMFSWFTDMESKEDILICGDNITAVLDHSFEEEKYTQSRLEHIRRQLNKTEEGDWHLRMNLSRYLELLKQTETDTSEYYEWLDTHRHFDTVRDIIYSHAEENKDCETMIEICLESIAAADVSWKKTDYLNKLVNAYRLQGSNAKVKQTLKDILFIYGSSDMKHIHELHKLCDDEEWEELREAYLSLKPEMKEPVYADEKIYDKLMEAIRDSDLKTYNRYYGQLSKLYPEEYIRQYSTHVQKIVQRHGGAVLYRELDDYLRKMANLKGGRETVIQILDIWERMFPSRKAMKTMMDDIRRDLS